jgi:hypothetical protein
MNADVRLYVLGDGCYPDGSDGEALTMLAGTQVRSLACVIHSVRLRRRAVEAHGGWSERSAVNMSDRIV